MISSLSWPRNPAKNQLQGSLPPMVHPMSLETGMVALRDFQNQLSSSMVCYRSPITSAHPRCPSTPASSPEANWSAESQHGSLGSRFDQEQRTQSSLHFGRVDPAPDRRRPHRHAPSIAQAASGDREPERDHPDPACGDWRHPGLEGPFSLLTLPEPIPDVGYTEGSAGTFYIEDRD